MANFGDFKGSLDFIISLLKRIDRHTECAACGNAIGGAGGGVVAQNFSGVNNNVPAGYTSVSIVRITPNDGTSILIALSDGSTYPLTEQGEVFTQSASQNSILPGYSVSGSAEWKWQAIQ